MRCQPVPTIRSLALLTTSSPTFETFFATGRLTETVKGPHTHPHTWRHAGRASGCGQDFVSSRRICIEPAHQHTLLNNVSFASISMRALTGERKGDDNVTILTPGLCISQTGDPSLSTAWLLCSCDIIISSSCFCSCSTSAAAQYVTGKQDVEWQNGRSQNDRGSDELGDHGRGHDVGSFDVVSLKREDVCCSALLT